MQTLRRADELHFLGGDEVGVLLAQQAGGWVLHPSAQALLPRMLAYWTASQGSTQPHPGSLYCCAHPGHPPHDSPGGVEEQTQWGDCVVKERRGAGSQDSRQEVLFGSKFASYSPSVTKGFLFLSVWGKELNWTRWLNALISIWSISSSNLFLQHNVDCSPKSNVEQDSDWWKDTVNTSLYWDKLLQRMLDVVILLLHIQEWVWP